MINYTTPTLSLTVEGVDLSGMDTYVSLEQGQKELTKTGENLTIEPIVGEETTDTKIAFTLTQEESAMFNFGKSVSLQVNFINASGVRDATEIKTIPVMRNLLDEVIAYGD